MTQPLEQDSQPWPSPVTAWSTVGLFCIAAILSYTDRQILSLLVDPIRADLHISDTQVGVLQGIAFAITYSFAGLPFGRLADLLPRRSVILAGVGLWSIGTLLCGYAGSFWILFAGRVIVGVGEAALTPAAMSMIADLFPSKRRGVATGVFAMGMVIGGGAAITIGGSVLGIAAAGGFNGVPILGALAPWRTALVLLGLCGIPLFLLLLLLREPARRGGSAKGQPFGVVFRELSATRAALVPLVLGCALMSVGDFAMLSWAPALLSRRYDLSAEVIGAFLGSAIIVVGVIATVGGGWLNDRAGVRSGPSGRLKVAAISAIVAIPFALIAFTSSANQVLAAVALWTLFSTVAGVAGMTAIQEVVPNEARGLSISFISFGNILIGLGGGAFLTGFVNDYVFADPLAVGKSLSLVVLPAGLVAIFLFFRASRAARVPTR
ncbi:MAG: MFS transporter [Sphingomonas sp.]